MGSALKEIMDYMNSNGDEIVATVIGRTNSNVSEYNNQILPFLINPILENTNNYYNGIDNYQCLLDIKSGKTLHDIKLYNPTVDPTSMTFYRMHKYGSLEISRNVFKSSFCFTWYLKN